MTKTHTSTLASRGWYPSHAQELSSLIQSWLPENEPQNLETKAVICPHAGVQYSGPVTTQVLAPLKGREFDRIIILGPSHFYPMNNQASIVQADQFETPLGTIPIDTLVTEELKSSHFITHLEPLHQQEHSIQVMLPFLQALSISGPVVPIVMGHFSSTNIILFSQIIQSIMTEKSLLLISSDFTHYGQSFGYRPFASDIQHNLRMLDLTAAQLIQQMDVDAFEAFLGETHATICGHIPIRVLMRLLKEPQGEIVHYVTSGELTGEWDHSVSYVGMTF